MHRHRSLAFLSMTLLGSWILACEQSPPTATNSRGIGPPALRYSFEEYGSDLGEANNEGLDSTTDALACARWQGCDQLSQEDYDMIYNYAASLMFAYHGDCHYVGFALLSLLGNGRIRMGHEMYGWRGAQTSVPSWYNPNTDDMVSNNIIIISPVLSGALFENRSILAHEGAHAAGARSYAETGEQRRLENESIYEPLAANVGQECTNDTGFQ